MPLTLDHLRRAQAGGTLPADVAAQVLADFAEYVRRAGDITLDRACGLVGPSGSVPWFIVLRLERRDAALRAAAELLCPRGTISEKADALRARIDRRYRATWQRRDQYLAAPIAGADPVDRQLFAAFRAGDGEIPDAFETLRKVVNAAASP